MKSAERSRFDAAHELGHLVMHGSDRECAGPEAERQANDYASAFLMAGLERAGPHAGPRRSDPQGQGRLERVRDGPDLPRARPRTAHRLAAPLRLHRAEPAGLRRAGPHTGRDQQDALRPDHDDGRRRRPASRIGASARPVPGALNGRCPRGLPVFRKRECAACSVSAWNFHSAAKRRVFPERTSSSRTGGGECVVCRCRPGPGGVTAYWWQVGVLVFATSKIYSHSAVKV
ncbi:ImmA/IrrE family metallo-endopeptidase [Streptomyces nojiriensis]|uniref:ImmA/IrrE family metallo-endopeptidase n=1 Tax=Streptomyces nojiriensis TaxID=66374 RepID=UPI002E18E0F4